MFEALTVSEDFVKLSIILIITFIISACSDTVSSHYSTYDEASRDRLFIRGWLPDILPKSTTQISTHNDLDLNTSRGKFNIPEKDLGVFIAQLEKTDTNTYSYKSDSVKHYWVFTVQDTGNVVYVLKSR